MEEEHRLRYVREPEADEEREIEFEQSRYILDISRDIKEAVGSKYSPWIDRSSALTHFPRTPLVNKHMWYIEAMHAIQTSLRMAQDKWKETLEVLAKILRADHMHYILGMRSYGPERERKLFATRITERRIAERHEEGKIK